MIINNDLGLVQIYTGNGKGKTTAALGIAFRALGHGYRVHFLQFLKGSAYAGELFAAQRVFPYLTISQFGKGCPYSALIRQGMRYCNGCGQCFVKDNSDLTEEKDLVKLAMEYALEVITGGNYDMVILDEIGNALKYKLVTVDEVLELIMKKPPKVELILTGRGIPQVIIDKAHLVTEMKEIKHPYQQGIKSRRGAEY